MNRLNKTVIILMASLVVLFADSVPAPPAIPELQIVSGNEEIKLIWDDKAEDSIDPLTGYSDFEGYRIYRSTDGGQTWGESWDRIYDYSGNHVAWKPYAQFDLGEESDTLHCIYSNAYFDEINELCFTDALPYDSLLSAASWLLEDPGVKNINDSLVYLPDYKRGNCPFDYDHDEHDWDGSHFANDCLNGGLVSEFDPMAAWINLGDNVGLKRSFVDTDVLDGVQYTYAVTAFDIGMKSFNVEFLSTGSGIANEKCDVGDLLTTEQEIRPFLEIEGYCESLPSCKWSDDDVCQYSDVNYCSGNDSYCDGMECCGADGCCNNDVDGIVNLTKFNCNLLSDVANHIWLPEIYTDKAACDAAEFIWKDVDHGFEDYSYKEVCEASGGRDWVVVEYNNEGSCMVVDVDYGVISEASCGEIPEAVWYGLTDNGDLGDCGDGISDYEWKIINFLPDTTWSSWNPGHFTGLKYGDDLWGYPSFESPKLYESFTDYNINGICDYDENSRDYEPFFDEDASDTGVLGKCDNVDDWSSRCPDNANTCKNTVVVESGYKASNVTFPADTPEIDFIVPDANNRGNGSRVYSIVNEDDLPTDPVILRFEINAGLDPESYGDITGSFATKNASLFIYEATSLNNLTPKNTKMPYLTQDFDSLGIDSLLGLPGASYESPEIISVPDYFVEDFKILSINNPLSESNFTDWFNGIQFRFDNGPSSFNNNPLKLVEFKRTSFSDTLLSNLIDIKMIYKYKKDLAKRPSYSYKIEFSTAGIDTAVLSNTPSGVCIVSEHALLPFKITNITTGNKVNLEHLDSGLNYGSFIFGESKQGSSCAASDCEDGEECFEGRCVLQEGFKNCNWERNEYVEMDEKVFTDADLEGSFTKLFNLKINFNFFTYALSHEPDFFGEVFFTTGWNWISGQAYEISDLVYYEGMLYRTNMAVSDDIPPNYWFDDTEDNINDNPWQILYPWNDGDFVIIEPYGWYQDGDAWVADLSIIGELDDNDDDDLENVSVVPNPYIVSSNYFNESPGNHLIRFTRLPAECTISIYTVSGEFVARLDHNDPFNGNEWWNIKNGRGKDVAPGLYIYVVETPGGESKIGKFAIVR